MQFLSLLLGATLPRVGEAEPQSDNGASEDLGAAIRRRREELFGPKRGTVGRSTIDVDSRCLGDDRHEDERLLEGLGSVQSKYEMEIGAHRETFDELLAAKNALIARLEETVRDRDSTIGQLRAEVRKLASDSDQPLS